MQGPKVSVDFINKESSYSYGDGADCFSIKISDLVNVYGQEMVDMLLNSTEDYNSEFFFVNDGEVLFIKSPPTNVVFDINTNRNYEPLIDETESFFSSVGADPDHLKFYFDN